MKRTNRYNNIRKMAVMSKMDKVQQVRFPAIGDEELGVKVISKSEFKDMVEMHKLKAHVNTQFMEKVKGIDHYMVGEIVKKYTDKMIDELIGNCSVQFIDRLKEVISGGVELTMAKMRLAYAIDESFNRHKEHMKIAAALDLGLIGPIIGGKVIRKNWMDFTQKDPGSCMPGTSEDDLVDPFTGLSKEEDEFLDELARESWGSEDDDYCLESEDDSDLMPEFDDDNQGEDDEFPF